MNATLRSALRRNHGERLPRLNVWDFDDTLVASHVVNARLEAEFPEIPHWKWSHDPEVSVPAALLAEPIPGAWDILRAQPGVKLVLTGRCAEAVEAWFDQWGDEPGYRGPIRAFVDIVSTSSKSAHKVQTAPAKAAYIASLCNIAEIHVYDDSTRNMTAIQAACPAARTHLMRGGKVVAENGVLVNPAGYTSSHRGLDT